jgi:hypothetical protein
MHAGRLNIKIHSAKIAPGVLKDGDKAQCAVKIVDYGALCTSPAASPGCSFEEELSFELGPIDDSAHGTAQVILYRDEDRTEIGRGSLNLLDFAASDGPTNFKVCDNRECCVGAWCNIQRTTLCSVSWLTVKSHRRFR